MRVTKLVPKVALVAGLVLAAGCTADGKSAGPTTASTTEAPGPTVPPDASITGATPCPAADGSSRRVVLFEQAPPTCIDPAKTYVAEVQTTGGTFSITLDQQKAPNNVNNFVVLARYHYFDGLPFDQNSPGNYIGSGVNPPPAHTDPGYRVPSEVPTNRDDYKVPGTVIIDNENAGGDGGIWVTLLDDAGVAPRFTIIGHVTAGLDVARQIGQAGVPPVAASSVAVRQIRIVET